jgi:hypothetical protein
MRSRHRRAFFLALALSAASACGSFGSNSPASGAVDAGIDAADDGAASTESPSDGSVEVSKLDGAPDATPATLCVGAEHWVCDDFDDDGSLSAKWTKDLAAQGSLDITTFAAKSPPNVVRATSPAASRAYFTHDTSRRRRVSAARSG